MQAGKSHLSRSNEKVGENTRASGLRELRGREASLPAEEVRGCFFRGWGRNTGSGPYGESRQRQVT